MSSVDAGLCQCPHCQQAAPHPDQERHRQMNLFLSRLGRSPAPLVRRRWRPSGSGHGGDRLLAQITGLDEKTIRRGRDELAAGLADVPADRVRRPGGGRPPVEKKIRPS